MGRTSRPPGATPLSKPDRPYGPNNDGRFALHQRQPRADKLDIRQRRLSQSDPAFAEALRQRVSDAARYSAFMAGAPSYVALEAVCPICGGHRRRTRDRSCYTCHLRRGGENFERIKAKLAPMVSRSRASYLDILERRKAEKAGESVTRSSGDLTARYWPTGRLEVTFPDGHVEPDFAKLSWQESMNAVETYPALTDLLRWAGWSV